MWRRYILPPATSQPRIEFSGQQCAVYASGTFFAGAKGLRLADHRTNVIGICVLLAISLFPEFRWGSRTSAETEE